jgi:hypothetical protein
MLYSLVAGEVERSTTILVGGLVELRLDVQQPGVRKATNGTKRSHQSIS